MITIKEINPATLNNPDAGERTLFVDVADGAVKTKDENGDIVELAAVSETPVSSGPLVYKAFLSQAGAGAPTVTIIENTLGAPIVWTRLTVGRYSGTLVGAFTVNKTFGPNLSYDILNGIGMPDNGGMSRLYNIYRSSADLISIQCGTYGVADYAELNATITVYIEVYP